MGRIDLSTVVAILCGIGLVLLAIDTISTIDLFLDPLSLLFVTGGVLFLVIASFSFLGLLHGILHIIKFSIYRPISSRDVALASIKVVEFCHKKGALQIEDSKQLASKAPIFYKWLQYVLDGQSKEQLRSKIEREIRTSSEVHNNSALLLEKSAAEAPIVGLIGTLIMLISAFAENQDLLSAGPEISRAFLPLLYGFALSHFLFAPLSSKLSRVAEYEIINLQIYKYSAFAVAEGESPRVLEQEINAKLPPSQQVHYFAK